jgi:hypothetical protein
MVAEWKIGRPLTQSEHVHHVDHDRDNWLPDNLLVFRSTKEHFDQHPEISQRMRDNNPAKKMTPEWAYNISVSTTGLRRSPESIENYKAAAIKREATMKGKIWWTEPDGSCHLSIKPRDPEATRGRSFGFWWTTPDGKTYQNPEALHQEDVRGRRGFNPHKPINHRVVSVKVLEGKHDVYCLEVPATGWFYANNVLVKNCSFCMINTFQHSNQYRRFSPEFIVDQIAWLYDNYAVSTIKIADEMFILNESHYTEICERLIAKGLGNNLNIWAYARIDTVKPTTLALLRRAGFRWLALGIESGSKHVRDGAAKRLRTDDIVGTVRAIQDTGINVIGNFMFGLRDDTVETMHQTLDLALECLPEFANFYSCMAYPGSALYDQALREGWTLPDSWRGYSQHNSDCRPLDTEHIDAATVLRFRDAAFNTYFTNPLYLAMIERKFGAEALEHVRGMVKYHLPRKLLGDTR